MTDLRGEATLDDSDLDRILEDMDQEGVKFGTFWKFRWFFVKLKCVFLSKVSSRKKQENQTEQQESQTEQQEIQTEQ